jgi:hypothetical protein
MQINYGFLLCVIFLLPIYFLINTNNAIGASDVLPRCNTIFSIGELNETSIEFDHEGFRYVQEVEIDADGIVDPMKIPARLIHPDASHYSPDRWDAVKEITINFKIVDDESGLFLRIARAGDCDTLVMVDGMNEYRVTAEMLGSGRKSKFGKYDLHLGTLNTGNHNILLAIPNDGLGTSGSIKWDAIILCHE